MTKWLIGIGLLVLAYVVYKVLHKRNAAKDSAKVSIGYLSSPNLVGESTARAQSFQPFGPSILGKISR